MLFKKPFFINIILFDLILIYILLTLINYKKVRYLQFFIMILAILIIFFIISKIIIN